MEPRRFKVLFVVSWYPNASNPSYGVFVREHAKAVVLYDDVVVLREPESDPTLKGFWAIELETDKNLTEGIPTYRVRYRPLPIPKTSYLTYLWSLIQAFRYLCAQGFSPDIIHGHVYEAGVLAAILGKLFHVPVVISEHASVFPRRLLHGLELWKARIAFKSAKYVLPVCKSLQTAIEDYGVRARWRIIPNVVSFNLFYPPHGGKVHGNRKVLLFVGNLEAFHLKGMPSLLRALVILRSRRSDWRLDVVGDGPAREEYQRLVADLDLSSAVTFHGRKTKSEVAEFMRHSDIFVLPSIRENLPCVLIEAMASGLPIVSTRVGGVPEIVDEESVGILVPPGCAAKLADALEEMLRSLPRYDIKNICGKAEKYSDKTVGFEIHEIYKRCNDNSAI